VDLVVRVEKVVKFASFVDALEWCYVPRVMPGRSLAYAVRIYSNIYPDSMVKEYGVVALRIEVVDVHK
jgi:ASC-1-like (ASCH) protein